MADRQDTKEGFEDALKSAPETIAAFEDRRTGIVHRIQHTLHTTPALVPLIVLLISIAVFGVLKSSTFFTPFALTLILQQVQIVGILAAAQSLVILTAGIDLSVGAVAVLCTVIMGQFTFRYGLPAELSLLIGLVFGALIGAISGFLVSRIKIPPFIVKIGRAHV